MNSRALPQPIVVTGGSGFIGTHLMTALLASGATVFNLDSRPPKFREHEPHWIKADMMNTDGVEKLIVQLQPALIYNLAAHASLAGGSDAMKVNVHGVQNLASACQLLQSKPMLVHASTQLVAGPAIADFDPLAYKPYGVYGESKVESEKLIRALPANQQWVIVRPTNIWGPHHPTFAHQIWRYISKRLYLHPANLEVVRSYGYVGNVVSQLIRIAEVDRALVNHQTFYIGDAPVPSTVWLDGFSMALTGKPVRRIPESILKFAAWGGEWSGRLGGPSPINRGRLERMTSSFPVPMDLTFAILCKGPYTLKDGINTTVDWLVSSGLVRGMSPSLS
jgi:nucleoside-diphosphate-sugar epimerase